MPAIVPGYEYDIFISYRQKDNKYDGWVMEFVQNLKRELDATFKEDITIYCDANPIDGLLETHNVNKSLEGKLKCLIFIPVISRTYCDPKAFAWRNEFIAFNKIALDDSFGRDIKLNSGNVASRILPVRIHDLDAEDKALIENEIKGQLRPVDFIYREEGVNRPLKPADNKHDNLNKTDYRNQINKTANAIKEIIGSLNSLSITKSNTENLTVSGRKKTEWKFKKTTARNWFIYVFFSLIIIIAAALLLNNSSFLVKGSKKEYKKSITPNPIANDWYIKAKFRLTPENKADVDSCIFFLKKAIDNDPLFALAHAELSRAYSIKNYWIDPGGGYSEEAFLEAERSLYLDPNLAEGYFARAYSTWTFQNMFPHEKTIREYKKAIALKPDMDIAYHQLAIVYLHVGLIDKAIDAIKIALKINPDNKFATIDLATLYFFTGKETDLELMIDLFKGIPDTLISPFRATQWATALITLGRFDEAGNILSAGIKKDSSDLFINSALAILLVKKGDRAGAQEKIEFCEKSNKNKGHHHHAVYNLAIAYGLLGNYQESVNKLTWVAKNGFCSYTFFRDDPLLISLNQFTPYEELLKKLKLSWKKFGQVANE